MTRSFSSTRSVEGLSVKAKSIQGVVSSTDNDCGAGSNPLVVIVGWVMAKQKHVSKYADVYNKLGCPTLTITPSILHSWNVLSYNAYTSRVIRNLDANYNGPIVFHLLSGSSYIILPYYTQNVDNIKNITLKGIVFDCGPVQFGYESGKAAAKQMLDNGEMNRLSYCIATCAGILMYKIKGSKIRQELSDAMISPALQTVPQLYVYSDKDDVTPWKCVEETMRQQTEECGRDVDGVMFNGADHVKLLQHDGIKYNNCIQSFLERINH